RLSATNQRHVSSAARLGDSERRQHRDRRLDLRKDVGIASLLARAPHAGRPARSDVRRKAGLLARISERDRQRVASRSRWANLGRRRRLAVGHARLRRTVLALATNSHVVRYDRTLVTAFFSRLERGEFSPSFGAATPGADVGRLW